jgi:hypothetical protein
VMRTDGQQSPPFDEQAALEELERLRDAIAESRRKRSQTSDEFEAFVRSFRTPSDAPSAPATDVFVRQQSRDLQSLPVVVDQKAPVEPPVPVEQREPIERPTSIENPAATPIMQAAPAPKRRTGSLLPRALGGAAILVASVLLLMRPWKGARSETPSFESTGGAPTTAAAPATTTPAPAATPAPPPATPVAGAHPLEAELNIQRRVWVRVLIDGQRTIERELPAGTRIPLQADRAIVIRAGDAGALRLTINGVDRGPLGKDSEIVTRTFTAPGTSAR